MWQCILNLMLISIHAVASVGRYDPDQYADVQTLVQSRGYLFQEHYVTTLDGYILTVHRIRHPRAKRHRRPVILQHGVLCTSREFLINSPGGSFDENKDVIGNNMAFELAKRGYDVWLPNSRGNTYSRNHTTLNPDVDRKFWDFSFDEMIQFDAPAVVDHVLKVTGRLTVGFIGHSQGTTILFGLLATRPEYNHKLKPCIAMAPITMVGNSHTPYSYLAYFPLFTEVIGKYGGPFLPSNNIMKFIASNLCTSRIRRLCSDAVFIANGFNRDQMNMTRLGVYASGFPAGTSSKNVIHFAQAVRSHKFSLFDYGDNNRDMYGSDDPPDYRLQDVTSRHIIIFLSENDWLSSEKDIEILVKRLRVPVHKQYTVPFKSWNHLDFLLGKDAGRFINGPILTIMQKYEIFK